MFVSLLVFCPVQTLTLVLFILHLFCEGFAGVLPLSHSSCSLSRAPEEVSCVHAFLCRHNIEYLKGLPDANLQLCSTNPASR